MIRMSLNGTTLNNTPDFGELKEVIELDDDLKTWIRHFDETELVFSGDGYNILKSIKDEFGYNSKAEVRIDIVPDSGSLGDGDVIEGLIYLVDVTFEHTKQTATVTLVEVYSEGLIKQNMNTDLYLLGVETSMNGDTGNIAAYTPTTLGLRLFDPDTGVHDSDERYGVNLVDAINFALRYIADDRIDFEDRYFSVEWTSTQFCLIKGRELRLFEHLDADKPLASFKKLTENAYKIFNVWYYIDYTSYKPKLILDHYDNIYAMQSASVTIQHVKNIEESFYQENFFTDIRIGTTVFIPPPTTDDWYLPFFNGFTHHEEKYFGKNNTMINQTLDLVVDWVMDHNVISRVVKNPTVSDYDNYMFLVECENAGVLDDPALAYNYALLEAATERRYNENLLNSNRLARFTLPVNVGFEVGSINDNFEAVSSTDTVAATGPALFPVEFDTEVSDPNNNYSPVTFRYTASVAGNYGFTTRLKVLIQGNSATRRIRILIYQSYASTIFKNSKQKDFFITGNTGAEGQICEFSHNMLMSVGDTIEIHMVANVFTGTVGSTVSVLAGSEFYTTYVQNQGGLVTGETSIAEYFGSRLEFEKNVPLNTWKQMKQNPVLDIRVTDGKDRMAEAKIKKVSRVIKTGKVSHELITKGSKLGL